MITREVIDGKQATVSHLNDKWELVAPADATLVKVNFDDGTSMFGVRKSEARSLRMNENHDEKGQFASGGGGSPKDQKVGDKVKDVFGNEGTVKGWHGQSGTVQVDVAGKLQYWHPSQFQRGLYVHCGPQGEILEERFNENHDEKGKFTSGGGDSAWTDKDGNRKFPTHSRVIETSPFKEGPREDYKRFKRSAFEAVKTAPVQQVKVDSLVSGQPVLDANRLKPFDKSSAEPIEVIHSNGNNWVVQGNHRAASAWVAKENTISAHVLDLDKAENEKYLRSLEHRYSEDQPRDAHGQWTSSGTSQSGDVKHTEYKGANRTIVVDHDTKENKITIKHLDEHGDLLVQQTHDSVGAARKELQSQGIDHKFYRALRQ